ncbi:MAG: hypothetical protein ACREUS_11380 [Burkholderiales bacterium]
MSTTARILGAGLVAIVLPFVPASAADERVEGIVRDTVVTHCDATRRGGCAGTLRLQRRASAGAETLTITVPLGTPISRDGERALLHSLDGKAVIVTLSGRRSSLVARAIEVAEPSRAGAAAGPGSPETC